MSMIGLDFSPSSEQAYRRSLNGSTGQVGPNASEVLRVLSLRLPQVLSGHPVAPAGLLNANPSPGPASAVLSSLGAPGGAPTTPGGSGGASAPSGGSSPVQALADGIPNVAQMGGGAAPGAPRVTPGGGGPTGFTIGGGSSATDMSPLTAMLQHFFPQGR